MVVYNYRGSDGMADIADSKSAARKGVRVRIPPPAPSFPRGTAPTEAKIISTWHKRVPLYEEFSAIMDCPTG